MDDDDAVTLWALPGKLPSYRLLECGLLEYSDPATRVWQEATKDEGEKRFLIAFLLKEQGFVKV